MGKKDRKINRFKVFRKNLPFNATDGKIGCKFDKVMIGKIKYLYML